VPTGVLVARWALTHTHTEREGGMEGVPTGGSVARWALTHTHTH
jgi:hypothetical protein